MEMTANGARVRVQTLGEKGAPVLLLHGWGCESAHMAFIAQALSDTHIVTTLDFPGHGQSGKPPEPWGVGDFAAMTADILTQTGRAPTDIVAHSFGGRVALYLAANRPELVQKMALTGCAGIKKQQSPEAQKRAARYQAYKKALSVLDAAKPLSKLNAYLRTLLQNKYGSPDYLALDDDMKKTFVKVVNEDLRPLLPRIQAETLLLWGRDDTETPLWMGKIMEKEMPNAGLAVLSGGHFAYAEQRAQFIAALRVFFDGSAA